MEAFQTKWPRWRQAEHTAANRGALCFGPNRGRQVAYTNPHRWLPRFLPDNAESALGSVVRRYLYAYGPATPHQFAQWLGVSRRWSTDLFDSLAGQLEEVDVEGTPAWVVAGDTAATSAPPRGVRLLPYFDAYSVGCHPRELVYPGRAAQRALAGGQGGNFPVLLINSTVAGVWHQRRSGLPSAPTSPPVNSSRPVVDRGGKGSPGRLSSPMTSVALSVPTHVSHDQLTRVDCRLCRTDGSR